MYTIAIQSFGGADVFKEMQLPEPLLKPGHVLVTVKATSVNPVDCKIRSRGPQELAPDFPAVLHGDFAGIVTKIGKGVKGFKIGDEVYGCAGGLKGLNGALADLMLVDSLLIAHKPPSLSFAEAAALPLVGLTAWEGLFDKAKIQKGQTILVHGATGGVGHIAIQLAKWAGAKVYTTVSSKEKAEIARNLGASQVINYREETVNSYVQRLTKGQGFDIVFDTIGGANMEKSFAAAAHYGQVIAIQSSGQAGYDLKTMQAKSLSLHFVFMLLPMLRNIGRAHHGDILTQLAGLVEQGQVRPLIDHVRFTFAQIGAAHEYLESGKAVGKVVVTRE